MSFIYCLKNVSGAIRYIGQTSSNVKRRLASHISSAKAGETGHRPNWIRSLLANGQRPTIEVLMEVESHEINDAERICIAFGRDIGLCLTNDTDGGDGTCGHTVSQETRGKISRANLGRKLTTATRMAMSKSRMGKSRSRSTILAIIKGKGGRPFRDQNGRVYQSQKDCARILGINQSKISRILRKIHGRGGCKSVHGYVFAYMEMQ